MAKKRLKIESGNPPRKKRSKAIDAVGDGDRLGKLVKDYRVNLAEVLVAAGIAGMLGGGLIWYALNQEPYSILWLIVGSALAIAGAAMLGVSLLNMGRRLELRKRGIRWIEHGSVTEFGWDDIVAVEIHRQDETDLGLASVQRRSSDGISASGPLTKTEWDVTIHSHDGRTIRLRPLFLKTVPDPKKLISQLRLGANLR